MSLNGLEDPGITEAYGASLREAAGWFLLHYIARDEVALLGAGTGGVDEAREVIAQYKENSPLYGFFNHSNHKILLKYIPEGVSRLLQARVAVHSHDVTDKFTHDVLHTVQAFNELTGAALSAACSLQGATSQARSSTGSSEKTQKLQETAEIVEEASLIDQTRASTTNGRSEAEPVVSAHIQSVTAAENVLPHEPLMDRPRPLPRASSLSSRFSGDRRSRGSLRGIPHPTEHAIPEVSWRTMDVLPSLGEHGSDSALASRPSLSDVYNPALYGVQPKVKLGPRPTTSKRQCTGGSSTARNQQRPVASLPPGMRAAPRDPLVDRPSSSSSRKSEPSHLVPQTAEHSALPAAAAPPVPEIAVTTLPRPTSKAGSYTSFSPSTMTAYLPSQRTTPERRRLMKALQLRRNQLNPLPPVSQMPLSVDPKEVTPVVMNSNISTLTAEWQHSSSEATIIGPKVDSGIQMNANVNLTGDNPPVMASPESLTSVLEDSETVSTAPSSVSDMREFEDPASPRAESPSLRTPVQSTAKTTNENIQALLPQLPDTPWSADFTFPTQRAVPAATQHSGLNMYGQNDNLRRRNLAPDSNHLRKLSAERAKRHGLIEPMHIDFNEDSTSGYISDDSFMEELQSAQVKEAKPVYATSVSKSPSKSPTSLLFPNSPAVERRSSSRSVMSVIIRRSSTLSRHEEHSDKGNARRGSTPVDMLRPLSIVSQRATSNSPDSLTPAKRNVSNGISRRIKVLADLSAREPELSQSLSQASVATHSSPSSLAVPGKASFRTLTKRPASFAQSSNLSPADPVRMTSAPISELYSLKHNSIRHNHSDFQTVYNLHENNGKTESISVTARIIRHAPIQNSDSASRFQLSSPQFHQSPLIIDHREENLYGSADRETPVLEQPKQPVTAQVRSPSKTSLTSPGAAGRDRSGRVGREIPQLVTWEPSSPTLPRPSFDGSWRNFRRLSRDTKSPPPAPRALSTSSLGESVGDEKKEEKRESMTSRLLKRVSLLSSGSRKSLASHPEKEETVEMKPSIAEVQPLPAAVAIGDLNVQFPDSLLWKRKWVAIDCHGYLIFGQSRAAEQPKGIVKRYHLAEFRAPCAPDLERQEMPHSIILEFVSGSSLQLACEDPAGQLHTLNTLQDYQRAWKYHEA